MLGEARPRTVRRPRSAHLRPRGSWSSREAPRRWGDRCMLSLASRPTRAYSEKRPSCARGAAHLDVPAAQLEPTMVPRLTRAVASGRPRSRVPASHWLASGFSMCVASCRPKVARGAPTTSAFAACWPCVSKLPRTSPCVRGSSRRCVRRAPPWIRRTLSASRRWASHKGSPSRSTGPRRWEVRLSGRTSCSCYCSASRPTCSRSTSSRSASSRVPSSTSTRVCQTPA
mmetsp:Transcript_30416/g.97265  ORF Transcript_30416/g.97265 Transcript_30416/m.97265 type:complete len:228 (-) Transcript_30416:958-1641(-)